MTQCLLSNYYPGVSSQGPGPRQQGHAPLRPWPLRGVNLTCSNHIIKPSCHFNPDSLNRTSQRGHGFLRPTCQERPLTDKATASQTAPTQGGTATVLQFYDRYNAGDIDGVMALMDENCSYHDTIYAEPFVGKDAIREYFTKVKDILGPTLVFVVENASGGDSTAVGVKWHVETNNGAQLPFSKGVSFYELSKEGKILAARDCVEPSIKPGASTLQVLKLITPLIQRLGPDFDLNAIMKRLPTAAIAIWLLYAGYMAFIFFSRAAPGSPILETPPRVFEEVLHESVTFFYVTPFLNSIGITVVPDLKEFPVSEAVFNFINAWSMMLWPLMLADPKGKNVKNKFPLYLGIQFLTNVFTIPYMALREQPRDQSPEPARAPSYGPAIGVVAGVVGIISLAWAVSGRPEYGGLVERWDWFANAFSNNRAFFAFILDGCLYPVWQATILKDIGAAPQYRYIPFFGLAAWLVSESGKDPAAAKSTN